MCFNEADGKFLWQAVHDKLPAGRVNDWPSEGICSSPCVEGESPLVRQQPLRGHLRRRQRLPEGEDAADARRATPAANDAGVLWRFDMMTKLGVFPHNLAVCSPLIVGDTLFVITSNGVDEDHIKIPQARRPELPRPGQEDRRGALEKQPAHEAAPGAGANLEFLKNTGRVLMHGQWSNPVYAEVDGTAEIIFPGGDGWLRAFDPKTGTVIWEFDANPEGLDLQTGRQGHPQRLRRLAGRSTTIACTSASARTRSTTQASATSGASIWSRRRRRRATFRRNFPAKQGEKGQPNPNSAAAWQYGGLNPGDPRGYTFGRTMSTASVTTASASSPSRKASCTAWMPRPARNTGSTTWRPRPGVRRTPSTARCSSATTSVNWSSSSTRKTKKIIGVRDMGSLVRATPVVANGVLYVMTENRLYAIQ